MNHTETNGEKEVCSPAIETKMQPWYNSGIFKTFRLFSFQYILGIGSTLLFAYLAYYHVDFIPVPVAASLSDTNTVELSVRLSYALRCTFPMVLVLFVGVALVGNKRALTDAINPLSGNENMVQVEKNFLTNTLEQFVISFAMMMIVASISETPQQLKLLPIYATMFVVARVVFYFGYRVHPLYRTVGMSSSFAALYILFGFAACSFWTKGLVMELGNNPNPNSGIFDKTEL